MYCNLGLSWGYDCIMIIHVCIVVLFVTFRNICAELNLGLFLLCLAQKGYRMKRERLFDGKSFILYMSGF